MNYDQAIHFLYDKLPMFSRVGSQAYRPGLDNIKHICAYLGNPEDKFKSIHIAGTNGKGSTSHLLSAALQCANYKTGLYTSPHLKNFTERIRINGVEVPQNFIADFVSTHLDFIENCQASFFEVTTAMAFDYFAKEKVEIAVIETGLGGRLDSTNIINPILSIITNISYDHKEILGDTLEKIATEKAGIIKKNIPIIISEPQKEVEHIFISKSKLENAPIYFTNDIQIYNISYQQNTQIIDIKVNNEAYLTNIQVGLGGKYQLNNLKGVIKAIQILNNLTFKISELNAIKALLEVKVLTGLKGRWQYLSNSPTIICDTGHNESGIREILSQLKTMEYDKLWMILGFVNDKDISTILALLPKEANYIFCAASIPRALLAHELAEKASQFGLNGYIIFDVNEAINFTKAKSNPNDLIFVGGSTFVVAEIDDL